MPKRDFNKVALHLRTHNLGNKMYFKQVLSFQGVVKVVINIHLEFFNTTFWL